MNVVPHIACIKLGLITSFVQIENNTIPHHYFNFVTYDHLRTRLNNHFLLTNYIGHMGKVSNLLNKAGNNMLKLTLQDQSGNFIEANLWEILHFLSIERLHYECHNLDNSFEINESLRVERTMQLGSTNASTIVINPEIEDLESIITRFKVVRGRSRLYPSTSTSTIYEEEDINMYTLEQLLQKSPKENHKTKFTCHASIKDIDNTRKWIYKSCTQCKKKVLPKKKLHVKRKFYHGEIESPRYMYTVNATIADDTASVHVVLFNDVMTSLLGLDCNEMIVKEDYPSPSILPSPLRAIKGKPKIFQLSI